jgi:phosphoribosylanthranilate isomerase
LTSVADAVACADAGVDWIGLNFHPGSPRRVEIAIAAEIMAALPATCSAVGLFVDRPPDEVVDIATRLGLRIVQLHGQEPPEDLVALAGFEVIRAFRLGAPDDIAQMSAYLDRSAELGRMPDYVLVDTLVTGQAGGTGQRIEPTLLKILPRRLSPRLVLAGGLTPENVAERVAQVRPWMVDVASGVEKSPGIKDLARVRAFVQAARSMSTITTEIENPTDRP